MEMNITGKTALITGGSSGIGLKTAKFLIREGVNIAITDKEDDEKLKHAKKELEKESKYDAEVMSKAADLTNNKDVIDLAGAVEEKFGGAHIVFHSAGARGAADDFLSLTDEDWMNTIEVDLMSAVRIARAFIPQMQKRNWGRMILVASENAFLVSLNLLPTL